MTPAIDPEAYLGFAKNVTRQLHRRWYRSGASFEDMLSGAHIGLLKAAHAYERAEPAMAFQAFAYWPIHDEIKAITQQEWRSRGFIDTTVGGRGGETHVKVRRLHVVPWPDLRFDDGVPEAYDPPSGRDLLGELEHRSQRRAVARVPLTPRERATVSGVLRGYTDVEIARHAGITAQCVNAARARVIAKAKAAMVMAALLLLGLVSPASAAWRLVGHDTFSPGANGGSSPAYNWTGADLAVFAVVYRFESTVAFSDDCGNTYAPLKLATAKDASPGGIRLVYGKDLKTPHPCRVVVTGTGGPVPGINWQVWAGSDRSNPLIDECINATGDEQAFTAMSPCTTPDLRNALVITAAMLGLDNDGIGPMQRLDLLTIDSGFAISDYSAYVYGRSLRGTMAYAVQATGSAMPTWHWPLPNATASMTMAMFRGAPGMSAPKGVRIVRP